MNFRLTLSTMMLLSGITHGAILLPGKSEAANKVPSSRVTIPLENSETKKSENIETIVVPTDDLPKPGAVNPTSPALEESRSPAPEKPSEIQYDLSTLPKAVRDTRQNILDAAATGDIEKLRPFIGSGNDVTSFSLGGLDGDPIAFLKTSSEDPDGQEILAILTEILEAGFVHMDAGTDDELYVWPYFFAISLDTLTSPQRVELFRILTFGDLEDSASFGGYLFYRAGIKPDGTWQFFIAGD